MASGQLLEIAVSIDPGNLSRSMPIDMPADGANLVGFAMSADFVTCATTFEGSLQAAGVVDPFPDWKGVVDSGNVAVSRTLTANKHMTFDPVGFAAVRRLRLVFASPQVLGNRITAIFRFA